MVVLAVIALVVVGPEKLPSLARSIGSFLNDLKRTTNTITSEINSTIDEEAFLKDQEGKSAVVDDETAELHGIDRESELEGVDHES